MTRRAAILLLVIVPLAALTGLTGLWLWQRERGAQLLVSHATARAAQEQAWAHADVQRKTAARAEAARSEQRRQNELTRALGSPAAVAFKTPHPDLRQMLEAVAHAVAPTGTTVRVEVDRFTEFEVTFDLAQDPVPEQLREAAKGLLTYGAPYLWRVRFTRNRRTLSELDRPTIESIGDWSAATPAQIEPLLLSRANPAASSEEAAPARGEAGDAPTPEDTSPLGRAFQAYRAATAAQSQRLRDLMQLQENSIVVEDVKTIFDLQARRERLKQATTELESLRTLYLNPGTDVRRHFADTEADSLAVRIFERGIAERSEAQRIPQERVFEALAARHQAALAFLAGMESTWGSWTANKLAGRIDFETAGAREVFARATETYNRCDQTLSAAMKQWAKADAESKRTP